MGRQEQAPALRNMYRYAPDMPLQLNNTRVYPAVG